MSDLSDESVSTASSETDSSFDELEELLEDRIRPKNQNYFEETIPSYNEQEFMEHFRVSRPVAESIAEHFAASNYFKLQAGCYGKLTSEQQIFVFLWFAGHQTASFRDVADRFDITISSLYRILRRVMYFLSNLSNQFITWPNYEEKIEIEAEFRQKGFPGVIGCIDGSHVKIDRPSEDPDSYLNRKGFHSIQMQVVCDHTMRIRDIFIGYPGSVHDSRILKSSPLYDSLAEKCHELYILGDSGYPLLKNLLTPFRDRGQLTRAQNIYNVTLSRNRYIVEHCFGLLKQKFRQLYHIKLKKIEDIVHFIRACCVMHNIALSDEFNLEAELERNEVLPVINNVVNEPDEQPEDREGIARRNEIVMILQQ